LTELERGPKQKEDLVMFLPFTKIRLANMGGSKKQSTREIERKFLLKRFPPGLKKFPHDTIVQGYLAVGRGGLQVRLRKKGFVRSLTFKQGTKGAREEREIRLSVDQFDALWPATAGRRLTKVRYDVPWKGRTIEIDIYRGRLAGLVVAEVEFDDERSCAAFVPPDWIGRDVTGKPKYSNVALALKGRSRES
jgi:CYTH domain-containing protein